MKKNITFLLIIIAVSFLTYCFFPIITYLPDYENKPGRIYIEDRNGIVITDKATQNGYYKFIETDLNSEFVKALIKIEDKNYYNHYGIDILSKFGAIKNNIKNSKVISGGSTITEQYIKNKFFINSKRTYLQKSREAILSFYFSLPYFPSTLGIGNDRIFLKNKILNMYFHNVYFGNNLYGVGAALEVYFGKEKLNELNEEEITLLLSLLHNPGIKSLDEKKFRRYFNKVKNKLNYSFERKIFTLNHKKNIDLLPFVTKNVTNVTNQASSVDSELQLYAKQILNNTLDDLEKKNVTNGAIFAMNPKTGEILIYQGSRDFHSKIIDGQVDVIKSDRQPGSTMKPFLYLQALEKGANPDDLIIDLESQYNSFKEGKTYISNNYSLKEYGLVRFKKALGNSFNNSSVRLARELGLQRVYNFYKKFGFKLDKTPEYYGYSLVLGNPSIKLYDLVMSYNELVPDGKDINKFLLYDILSDPDNRDVSFGVNSILNTSITQAVKTGTSSDFRDNLVISYHPDLVVGVWIGNNDNSSMIGVTGITGAGYIWHHVIEKAIKLGYINNKEILIPEGIEESEYCLDEKCFRKELIYKKNGKEYFSRVLENKYSIKDVFEKFSGEEIGRLKDFQIYISDN